MRSGSHSCWSTGWFRPSFVPPPEIRRLRMLTRYRVQLMGDRRRDIVRLELMLEDASIKLSSVVSSLKTVSARAMLTAMMINGETDPLRLADLAKGRMRRKIPDLAQALTGHFDANHARLARSMLQRLDLVDQAMAELDQVIVEACQPWGACQVLCVTIVVDLDVCGWFCGRSSGVDGVPVLDAVKIVPPVGGCILTAPARRRHGPGWRNGRGVSHRHILGSSRPGKAKLSAP